MPQFLSRAESRSRELRIALTPAAQAIAGHLCTVWERHTGGATLVYDTALQAVLDLLEDGVIEIGPGRE